MSDIVKLSASRIKTAQQCSWTYWCKYVLKLPDSSNEGASRGTICHNIFELLGDKHKREFNKIVKEGTIWNAETVATQVRKEAKELAVDDEENLELIDEMIVNGLRCDFFGDEKEKPKQAISEKFFDIKINDGDKRYAVRGYIDKLFVYKDNSAVIRDFKSSKQVFKGKEVTDNLQNLIYCLAVKHIIPKSKPRAEFIFLRFDLGKDLLGSYGKGFMKMDEITEDELEGFEYQLTEFNKYLENYDYKKATSNYAARQDYPKDGTFGGPLACGKDGYKMSYGKPVKDKFGKKIKAFICPFRKPMTYYALVDEEGNILKTKFKEDKELLSPDETKGETVKEMEYEGCPHWQNKKKIDFLL
tara:strand:+ start:771 stop:1844 length:1074 start_codon:yes stop_codon:yes gene_type:complete